MRLKDENEFHDKWSINKSMGILSVHLKEKEEEDYGFIFKLLNLIFGMTKGLKGCVLVMFYSGGMIGGRKMIFWNSDERPCKHNRFSFGCLNVMS